MEAARFYRDPIDSCQLARLAAFVDSSKRCPLGRPLVDLGSGSVDVGGLGSGGDGFASDPLQQGGAELTDLAADCGWVGGLELCGQAVGVDVVEYVGVSQEPLARGLPDVIGLGDLGPDACFGQ